MGINILGSGSYIPKIAVDNNMMSSVVDTNDEWITTRTGINVRRMTDDEPTWYMGAEASKKAIEAAGISPEDIGLIIDSTITSDFHTPSTACIVQREIGAENAACFDLGAACSGFVYGVDTAMRYLMTDDTMKYALVCANEELSRITNYEDRTTCVLFGDGASAVVLERSDSFYTSWLGSDGNGAKLLFARAERKNHPFRTEGVSVMSDSLPETNHEFIYQDGKEVYKFATKALPTAVQKAAEKAGCDIGSVDVFVPHQANVRIIETAAKNLGVSMDKFVLTLDMYGNTSSASIPLAFDHAVRNGRIKRGDRVCFVGFGAGLTLGAIIFDY